MAFPGLGPLLWCLAGASVDWRQSGCIHLMKSVALAGCSWLECLRSFAEARCAAVACLDGHGSAVGNIQ